jgi:hypothetical protein
VRTATHSGWAARVGFTESQSPATSGTTGRTWIDLANNRPGASVRSKALEARRSEPVWTLLSRVASVHTDERAWRTGVKGEELVARELARLDSRWHVLHSIPIGDCADIDHLVIGPAGVFSLNAKHHKYAAVFVDGDLVTVNGHQQPYVEKSRHEARRVSRVLSEAVGVEVATRGVVVVVNVGQFTISRQSKDVLVVDRRRIRRRLLSLPAVDDSAYRERLFQVARRSSTWRI